MSSYDYDFTKSTTYLSIHHGCSYIMVDISPKLSIDIHPHSLVLRNVNNEIRETN